MFGIEFYDEVSDVFEVVLLCVQKIVWDRYKLSKRNVKFSETPNIVIYFLKILMIKTCPVLFFLIILNIVVIFIKKVVLKFKMRIINKKFYKTHVKIQLAKINFKVHYTQIKIYMMLN